MSDATLTRFHWMCSVHYCEGVTTSLTEAQHLASAHLSFYTESVYEETTHVLDNDDETHAESIVIETESLQEGLEL